SDAGYSLVFKQTVQYKEGNKITYKGNVDSELVLYAAAKTFNLYNQAVIVSGDGDFRCLIEFLIEHKKFNKILCPNNHYSSLLREYSNNIDIIGKARQSLEYKKSDQHRRSVETLGLSGHGDVNNIAKKTKKVNTQKTKPSSPN